MTSLAGCSGEDFASVLRSLGYRMEKRPKPAEPPPASEAIRAGGASAVGGSCARRRSVACGKGHRAMRPRRLRSPLKRNRCGDAAVEMSGTNSGPVAARAGRSEAAADGPMRRRNSRPSRCRLQRRSISMPEAPTARRFRAGRSDGGEPGCVSTSPPLRATAQRRMLRPRNSSRSGGPAAATSTSAQAAPRTGAAPAPARAAVASSAAVAAASDATAEVGADSAAAPAADVAEASPAPDRAETRGDGRRHRAPIAPIGSEGPSASRARVVPSVSCAPTARRAAIRPQRSATGRSAATARTVDARRSSGSRSGPAREIHQGARRGQGPPRPRARSEFAVRQARGAQGAARGERQGAALRRGSAWTASASTSGCGTRGWCVRARRRRRSPPPVMCASTASASMRRAAPCGPATW